MEDLENVTFYYCDGDYLLTSAHSWVVTANMWFSELAFFIIMMAFFIMKPCHYLQEIHLKFDFSIIKIVLSTLGDYTEIKNKTASKGKIINQK